MRWQKMSSQLVGLVDGAADGPTEGTMDGEVVGCIGKRDG